MEAQARKQHQTNHSQLFGESQDITEWKKTPIKTESRLIIGATCPWYRKALCVDSADNRLYKLEDSQLLNKWYDGCSREVIQTSLTSLNKFSAASQKLQVFKCSDQLQNTEKCNI